MGNASDCLSNSSLRVLFIRWGFPQCGPSTERSCVRPRCIRVTTAGELCECGYSVDRARLGGNWLCFVLIVVAAAQSGASILYTEDMNHEQEILGRAHRSRALRGSLGLAVGSQVSHNVLVSVPT